MEQHLIKFDKPIVIRESVYTHLEVEALKFDSCGGALFVSFNPAVITDRDTYECLMLAMPYETFSLRVCPMKRKNQKKIDACNEWLMSHATSVSTAYELDLANQDKDHTYVLLVLSDLREDLGI